jgi:hypothetical protein
LDGVHPEHVVFPSGRPGDVDHVVPLAAAAEELRRASREAAVLQGRAEPSARAHGRDDVMERHPGELDPPTRIRVAMHLDTTITKSFREHDAFAFQASR